MNAQARQFTFGKPAGAPPATIVPPPAQPAQQAQAPRSVPARPSFGKPSMSGASAAAAQPPETQQKAQPSAQTAPQPSSQMSTNIDTQPEAQSAAQPPAHARPAFGKPVTGAAKPTAPARPSFGKPHSVMPPPRAPERPAAATEGHEISAPVVEIITPEQPIQETTAGASVATTSESEHDAQTQDQEGLIAQRENVIIDGNGLTVIPTENQPTLTAESPARVWRPEMNAGEVYAGVILGDANHSDYHLILLSGEHRVGMLHKEATAWAASIGGHLPSAHDASLLSTNAYHAFLPGDYWTSDVSEDGKIAISQGFMQDEQRENSTDHTRLMACSVRRVEA